MLHLRSVIATRVASIRFLSLSSRWGSGFVKNDNPNGSEPLEDFEQRIFGSVSETDPKKGSFFEKLERSERARDSGFSFTRNARSGSRLDDGFGESFNTLEDGMDKKLKKAATSFIYDEMFEDGYKYRPDVTFYPDSTYELKDLDVTKPAARRFPPQKKFLVTTEQALKKADFRNVRFLANFISEAGLIIKRTRPYVQTGISAKAQRKIAREIKTARAFGLMPFISMGTKPFAVGRSMKNSDLMNLQFVDNSSQLDDDTKDDITRLR